MKARHHAEHAEAEQQAGGIDPGDRDVAGEEGYEGAEVAERAAELAQRVVVAAQPHRARSLSPDRASSRRYPTMRGRAYMLNSA